MTDPRLTDFGSGANRPGPKPMLLPRRQVLLRTILVPIDFSEASWAALDHAVNVVSLAGVHVVLLHVLERPRAVVNSDLIDALQHSPSSLAARCQQSLERMEPLCREFQMMGSNCTARVRIGVPHEEILSEAEQVQPDLIILAHRGGGALSRFLLGSSAERVVRHANCTVVVARHAPE